LHGGHGKGKKAYRHSWTGAEVLEVLDTAAGILAAEVDLAEGDSGLAVVAVGIRPAVVLAEGDSLRILPAGIAAGVAAPAGRRTRGRHQDIRTSSSLESDSPATSLGVG